MDQPEQLVVCTDGVCGGAPRVRGRRVTVFNLVLRLLNDSVEDVLNDFPELNRGDLKRIVDYCRTQQCVRDKPLHYCDGCTLRKKYDQETFQEFLHAFGEIQTTDTGIYLKEGLQLIFLGSFEELKRRWKGENGWDIADAVIVVLRKNSSRGGTGDEGAVEEKVE